ncbi:unnamed protein product [Coffea canephora]|uniref:Uncharacterized protein n=2 Tax=Coffea TaxID=13442 RepID=A0A068UWG0_COFCA|nr:uncharacterized protein LOC113738938 [Coffea arabica]CDP12721.1 unnamed protein product [Coffea canephora]
MKKKQQQQEQRVHDGENEHDLEIIKAVAQAWYANSSSSKSSPNEFDAHRRNFKGKPSRFKLEAARKASSGDGYGSSSSTSSNWDFGQSLWDSYEIVTIARRLERGLVLDHTFSEKDDAGHVFKKRKESKNSLRNLLNRISSRRFNEPLAPQEEGNLSLDKPG